MNRNLEEFVNQHSDIKSPQDVYGGQHVAVLLAHYNGGKLLADQLQSLSAQTHKDWSLILSDDGSSDDWLGVSADFAKAQPKQRVWLVNGPRRGFAQNFLSLVSIAGPSVPYAAFCDQDDVWLPKKLETALNALKSVRPCRPALYCSRTMICDQRLASLGPSPLFSKPPSFQNALVQNIGGGNTMVLNRAALDLLQDTLHHATGVVSHDWWAYQLVSGAGGKIIYDDEPSVLYRQHMSNLIGSNSGWCARAKRLSALLRGQFKEWNDANIAALQGARHWLTPEARQSLDEFEAARRSGLFGRVAALRSSGVYRQTSPGQIALWIANLLKKLQSTAAKRGSLSGFVLHSLGQRLQSMQFDACTPNALLHYH